MAQPQMVRYTAVYRTQGRTGRPVDLVAHVSATHYVAWRWVAKGWACNPMGIGDILADEADRTRTVDRPEAERIAHEHGHPLPGEEDLRHLCREWETERNNHRWPRSLLRLHGQATWVPPTLSPPATVAPLTYCAVYPSPEVTAPVNLACIAAKPPGAGGHPWAVSWNRSTGRWVYNGPRISRFLLDESTLDEKEMVDEATARRIAEQTLGTSVPTVEEVRRISTQALAALREI